jgi:hypothetical protein
MLFSRRAYSSSTSCSSGVRVSEPDGAEVCDVERWCVAEGVSVAIVSIPKLENGCRCGCLVYEYVVGVVAGFVYNTRRRRRGLRIGMGRRI